MIFSRANIATFSTSVAIQICGLITGILTARLLGPTARGEFATVMLWPMILSNLGLMGLNWALAREVGSDPGREADWVSAAVALGIAASLVYFVLGFLMVPFLLPSDRQHLVPLTRACLLLIPLDVVNQILLAVDHGRMRWRRYNFARVSFFIFYAILICSVWAERKTTVRWFVWAFLIAHLIAVLIRLGMQAGSFFSGKLRIAECRHLMRSGLPFFWAGASNLLTLQLDKVLVVGLMNMEAVGIYAVAVAFGNAQSSLGEALGITSFAVLSNEKNADHQGTILSETFRQATLSSAGFGLLLACVVPFLIKPLFGLEFSDAARPAVILTFAAALTTSSSILNQGLRGAGRPYPGIASQLLGTGVLAVAAVLLLPRLGLMGMAWAVVLSGCCQLLVLVIAAATAFRVSLASFWPFSARDIRVFCQNVMELRVRYSRSPA
jgi:O-antigen/teichoic acid export membrane protein